MTKRDDGGPAFPTTWGQMGEGGALQIGSEDGMSLRDYFAGQALAGLLTHEAPEEVSGTEAAATLAATQSYALADAMLAERNKETS